LSNSTLTGPARWFQPAHASADAEHRVILFPPAGSGGTIYRNWHTLLPVDVTCQVVQLPGRLARRHEEQYAELDPLIEDLHEAVDAEMDGRPYAFFGHSMGAQLAYLLTQAIEQDGGAGPVLLGASGWAPRGFALPTLAHSQQAEQGLVEWVRAAGSLPDEISADPAALSLVLPTLRADLALCTSYVDRETKLECPVVTYSGRSDPLLSPDAMSSWVSRSVEHLGHSEFPGGHFYIDTPDHALAVLTDFVRHFRSLITRSSGDKHG
jgi:surfactin synthase thioesterase subunit